MRTCHALYMALLAKTITAQGFLNFDIEKRLSGRTNGRLTRRAGGAILSPMFEDLFDYSEYIINVTVGTPGQQVGLTLDTGSSVLWLPSSSFCNSNDCDYGSFNPNDSSTYQTLAPGGFNITYAGPGDSDAGDWASDLVSIGDSSPINNQSFGLEFEGADVHGVLGLGTAPFEVDSANGSATYSALIDNLVQNGLINRGVFSLYLNSYEKPHGNIVFGGIDTTKYSGDLVALPMQVAPDGTFTSFYVTLSKVTFTDAVGSTTILSPDGYAVAALLDTGTPDTGLTNDVLSRLTTGMGSVSLNDQTLFLVPCNYNTTNATINYTFGGEDGVTISVPISETIGLPYEDQCGFGFGPLLQGAPVLGDTFLRSAYVVFDVENQVVAMAQAVSGAAGTSNIVTVPTGTSLPGVVSTASAPGTYLPTAAASVLPTLVTAATSSGQTSIAVATPTFDLGTATRLTTGKKSSSNAASLPTMTGLSQAALLGAGLVVGAFVL